MTQVVHIYITTAVQVEPIRKKDEFTELCNLLRPFILTKCNKIELRGVDCSGKFFFTFDFLNDGGSITIISNTFEANQSIVSKMMFKCKLRCCWMQIFANLCCRVQWYFVHKFIRSFKHWISINSVLSIQHFGYFYQFFFPKKICLLLASAVTLHTVIVHLVRIQNFPKN